MMIKDNDSNMCNIYYKILVMLKCERLIHIEHMRKQSILFLSCTAVVMGLLYQFERKVDFILPIYNLMILSTSPFIIYHFCGIPSSNYYCFPKFQKGWQLLSLLFPVLYDIPCCKLDKKALTYFKLTFYMSF